VEDSRHEAVLHLANAANNIRFIPDYKGASTRGTLIEHCIGKKMVIIAKGYFRGRELEMRLKCLLVVGLLATMAQAKEPKHYQSGKLVKMQSVKCGTDAKDAKSLAGEMLGTDSQHMKTRELLCQEYMLATSSVTYTIRPKEEKHPALLPIGNLAQFRLDKDKLLLRVEDYDDKEREYEVISMTPNDGPAPAIGATPLSSSNKVPEPKLAER
jgi:hypothetical protein